MSGKECVVVDDIIETGARMMKSSKLLKEMGAKEVACYATHGIFAGQAVEGLAESDIREITITNTLPMRKQHKKIQQLSVGILVAEAIRRDLQKEGLILIEKKY